MSKDYLSALLNKDDNIHTVFPAIVISYDEAKQVAIVQPIFQYDDGQQYPQIQNVPVAKSRYKFKYYRVAATTGTGGAGDSAHNHTMSDTQTEELIELTLFLNPNDLVLCVCSERSIDSMSSKQVHNPQSKRKYDLSDAMIVCIL